MQGLIHTSSAWGLQERVMSNATILLVDDDPVLSQVLHRVLARQGHDVIEAGSMAEAREVARQRRPGLALIDLDLPDGDGVQLARKLEKDLGPTPVILMTAYPLRLRDQPRLASGFARVLTKPLNIEELHEAVDVALAVSHPAPPPAEPEPAPADAAGAPEKAGGEPAPQAPVSPPRRRRVLLWVVPAALVVLAAVLFLGLPALGMPSLKDWLRPAASHEESVNDKPVASAVPGDPDGLELPPETVEKLGVTTAVVQRVATPRPLVLAGSLSFDPNRLYRIQPRFAGEVLMIGKTLEPGSSQTGGQTRERDLRYGDRVRAGDLLAVVLSKDLGEKKSELVDSLVRLHLDEVTLAKMEDLVRRGLTPEIVYRQQRTQVSVDRNAAARAELTLRTWRLPEAEIQAVKDEAARIQENPGLRDLARETEWAKVEVKAPASGTIVEKNVTVGNMVDPTFDLFKVADLRKLGVVVNAYEEDMRNLQSLPRGFPWDVRVPAEPSRSPLKNDGIEQLGWVVDPNQRTAPVMGRVDNASGELRVGQFVTATVELPAPPGVVAVPAAALDENGEESIVFVQPDPGRPRYSQRRVAVTQRLGDVVYVRSELTPGQLARGLRPIRPGERVVTRGVVELKATLGDLKK
jgi:cobalt-zinc-cadmium efflux system membrane fusion protein